MPTALSQHNENESMCHNSKHANSRNILHGKMKVSKQDCINEVARRKVASQKRKDHNNTTDKEKDRRMHIVQCKKAQYQHLESSHQDQCPIVYSSGKKQDRKEVAALWLQPFTVVDD